MAPVPVQPSGVAVAQASVASAPAAKLDQAATHFVAEAGADVSVKQDSPQPLPAQPLPLMDKHVGVQLAKKPPMPAKAAPLPMLKPEANIDKGASNYLQVPFSKGDVAGLITISKAGAERPDQLLLNPSSASIFSHLSDNLAQAPDPRWRLTDQQGREHSHGHNQGRPDEEAEEGTHQAFQDKRQQGRLET
ncbi:hypothetical protein [Pseudomonas brassicacearum]|uniref:SpaN/EivJ family type III secretion system needle length determinant n=1 Tax=Pseudomonas brassicacearum TaxID=930166 RepID=UPI000F48C3F9|nr:hypothetical protein [Pseudomonas brassicacearum]